MHIRIRGRRLSFKMPLVKNSTGLGDVVKRATSAVGIRPCSGCQRRAEALNRLVVFGPSGRKR